MKKLLIIIGIFLSVVTFGQDIARDSLTEKTTTVDLDYGLVISGASGAEQIYRMSMPYYQPMLYSAGYVRPRNITDRLMLGTTTNYAYGLYNAGTSYFNNTVYNATGVRHYFGSTWVSDVSGNLSFYDPTVGTKTLYELTTSGIGTIDTTGLPDEGMVAVFTDANKIGMLSTQTSFFALNSLNYGMMVINSGQDVWVLGSHIHLGATTADLNFTTANFNGKLSLTDTTFYPYLNMSAGDTNALLVIGNREKILAYPLTPASAGWDAKIKNYFSFYRDSKLHKALPLPYPDGTERRQLNEVHRSYQTEFELERLHRYFFRMWIENKIQWLLILLLAFGLYKVRK